MTSIFDSELVSVVDTLNKLKLINYKECNETSSDELKKCRGVVVDEDMKVIFQGFPYTHDLSTLEEIDTTLDSVKLNSARIWTAFEGTTIRVFHNNDKWYVTTTGKLNAFKCSWGCWLDRHTKESFGDLFEKALDIELKERGGSIYEGSAIDFLCKSLDTSYQYVFIVQTDKESRVVCRYDTSRVYHIGTFKNGIDCHDSYSTLVPKPDYLNFKNAKQIWEYVLSSSPFNMQGCMIYLGDKIYRVVHPEYKRLNDLRANEPRLMYRYLQVRMDSNLNTDFRELYNECDSKFESCENDIFDLTRSLYTSYVNRYIKGEHVILPKCEFEVLREAHEWHKEDKKTNKVYYTRIMDIINALPPNKILTLLRSYNNPERRFLPQLMQKANIKEAYIGENDTIPKLKKRKFTHVSNTIAK
jgi:hypothetical protein